MAKSEFISLKDLFNNTFEIFKDRLKTYFGLWGMAVLGFFLYFLFIILGLIVSLGTSFGMNNFSSFDQFLASFDFTKLGIFGLLFMVLTVGLVVFMMAIGIANILLVDDGKSTVGELIKKGLPMVLPLMLASFLSGLIIMGGFFALIVPGMIMAVMLSYVSMEVVLGEKRGVEAIKSSMLIISQSFWDIVWKYFLIWLIMIGVNMVLGYGSEMDGNIMAVPFALLSLVYAILSPFFFMTMGVLIYKEAKKKMDRKKEQRFTWVYIVSVLGWLIMIAGMVTFGSIAMKGFRDIDLEEVLDSREKTGNNFDEFEEAIDKLEESMGEMDTEVNYDNYLNE